MKNKKWLTFTNVIVIITIIVYILNIFVISPDTGSMSQLIYSLVDDGHELPNTLIFKIIGFWGGHVNDLLGFEINKIFSGEIWRVFTVVFTHAHLAHFVTNMIALLIAGNNIEKKYGTLKSIGIFILLTTIQGFLTDFICFNLLGNEIAISYGASGLITVLFGMILIKSLLNKGYFKDEFKKGSRVYLVIYFIFTTFIITPNLFTIVAHMTGLIVGLVAEYIIYKYINNNSKKIM